MPKIILIFLFIIPSTLLAQETFVICPLLYLSSVKKLVEANGQYDKFKHCSISCILTLKCPAVDVLEIGIIKEVIDAIGPGNAEMGDLKADYQGVKFATSNKSATDKSCMSSCHKIYPEMACP